MADVYVDSNLVAGKDANPANMKGAQVLNFCITFETASTDAAGDVKRLIKGISNNMIPYDIKINCDAIAGATDIDLGLYEIGAGKPAIDKDLFMDGADIHAGAVIGSEIEGLQSLGLDDFGKKLYELAGETVGDKKEGYDLALTFNSDITAAGTITVRGSFIQG